MTHWFPNCRENFAQDKKSSHALRRTVHGPNIDITTTLHLFDTLFTSIMTSAAEIWCPYNGTKLHNGIQEDLLNVFNYAIHSNLHTNHWIVNHSINSQY